MGSVRFIYSASAFFECAYSVDLMQYGRVIAMTARAVNTLTGQGSAFTSHNVFPRPEFV